MSSWESGVSTEELFVYKKMVYRGLLLVILSSVAVICAGNNSMIAISSWFTVLTNSNLMRRVFGMMGILLDLIVQT